MVLMVPKDRSGKATKVMVAKVEAFLDSLTNFNKEADPEFKPDLVGSKSYAAIGIQFQKAVLKAELDAALNQRVSNLLDNITSSVFQYTTREHCERDKPTYIAQLTFQQSLCSTEELRNPDRDMQGSAKCWRKSVESECPEKEIPPRVEE
ncbi:hypothetical protein Q5P01_023944 [Channa striata]|uniref:Dynein heavy chain coiled coil stalk domain-containing protein n=1 Tax=Channa striata TaxID=64152 RepID=A0AA88LP43_CHASR|nr:hypothetical protein Q5P01_023944 [Channa striata]